MVVVLSHNNVLFNNIRKLKVFWLCFDDIRNCVSVVLCLETL